jgi:hypothetical protein
MGGREGQKWGCGDVIEKIKLISNIIDPIRGHARTTGEIHTTKFSLPPEETRDAIKEG